MPLVSRGGQRNVFVQSEEPSEWSQGCVWSDTDNEDLFKNVCGTATQVGGSIVTCTTIMPYCQTNANYTSPCSAVASSSATCGCPTTTTNTPCGSTPISSGGTFYGRVTCITATSIINSVGIDIAADVDGLYDIAVYECACCVPGALIQDLGQCHNPAGVGFICACSSCSPTTSTNDVWVAWRVDCPTGESVEASSANCATNGRSVGGGGNSYGCLWPACAPSTSTFRISHARVTHDNLLGPGNAVNCCNCDAWQSNSEVGPSITVDVGAADIDTSIMLRKAVADTVVTYSIRASCDAAPSACDEIRRVTASCLTDSTDRFVRFNVKTARFVRIIGIDACAAVGSFENIKIEQATTQEIAVSSGRLAIAACDTSLGLCGS